MSTSEMLATEVFTTEMSAAEISTVEIFLIGMSATEMSTTETSAAKMSPTECQLIKILNLGYSLLKCLPMNSYYWAYTNLVLLKSVLLKTVPFIYQLLICLPKD